MGMYRSGFCLLPHHTSRSSLLACSPGLVFEAVAVLVSAAWWHWQRRVGIMSPLHLRREHQIRSDQCTSAGCISHATGCADLVLALFLDRPRALVVELAGKTK